MNRLDGVPATRLPNSSTFISTEYIHSRRFAVGHLSDARISPRNDVAASAPCIDDPQSWDVDAASPSQLIAAAERCVECPLLKACRRQAESGVAAAMVWGGTIYDERGNAVDIATVRAWTARPRGLVYRSSSTEHTRAAS